MGLKLIRYIFFGNYFIGLLAIALTIESTLQLKLPFNSFPYYLFIALAPIVYYTYAYMGVYKRSTAVNPRTQWYIDHQGLIKWSQRILSAVCVATVVYFVASHIANVVSLPLIYWLMMLVPALAALLYYGLLPSYFFNLNLRNTGWLKPFIIGFVWACTANVLPLIALKVEHSVAVTSTALWIWLFVKNWMFCTVNAIMFDMKDYEIDANRELKTFAVRMGLKKTITQILIPLLSIGLLCLCVFTYISHFKMPIILFNAAPFLLTLLVAISMNKKKSIFYYLVVIDGLILVKALCGIAGVLIFDSQ